MIDRDTLRAIHKLQTSAPVNIVGIAKYIGLSVWEDENLPDGISGKIFRDANHGGSSDYSIVIRAQDPTVRKRFYRCPRTRALCPPSPYFKDILMDVPFTNGLGGNVEAQANGLAADLLMPWHILSRFLIGQRENWHACFRFQRR